MKRLILLLDGTWNDPEAGSSDTNVVRLREIIAKSLDGRSALIPAGESALTLAPDDKIVAGRTYGGEVEHLVFYHRGVGTGPLVDTLFGGAFGEGLDLNIRRAYKFLSFYYQPGDQIFVFGFSRGAYTARSLIGLVAAAGLLRREHCTEDLERKVWSFYRTKPADRLPGIWTELGQYVHSRDKLRIECVGVFDTVGALGVPLPEFWRVNREKYEFHDVNLSSITKVNLHAVGIDEHRRPFEATVWRKPKFKYFATKTEQVWFPGAHADVGGGHIDEEKRLANQLRCLDDIPLDWMIRRLLHYFPDFPISRHAWKLVDRATSTAGQHESRKGFYKLFPFAYRSIANRPVPVSSDAAEENVTRDRHAEPIGEMLHISAIERWGEEVSVDHLQGPYSPKNLAGILPLVEATYAGRLPHLPEIRIVNWSGDNLDPENDSDCADARRLIAAAIGRLTPMVSSVATA